MMKTFIAIAIHLDRTINESWKFNKETEFQVSPSFPSSPYTLWAFTHSSPSHIFPANHGPGLQGRQRSFYVGRAFQV